MTKKIEFSSGLRLVIEQMPYLRSVTTGVWIKAGSVWEEEPLAGISHFLEHMLFKGTTSRSAKQIAETMESVGGIMNAFTSREHTCFYIRCIDEDFELSMDLLADMHLNSVFAEDEFTREKNVVTEEINSYEDTPDDLVTELMPATMWPRHSYGRAVIGSRQTVEAMRREDLIGYWQQMYQPRNTVIAIAGNIDEKRAVAAVEKFFAASIGDGIAGEPSAPEAVSGTVYVNKDIEQTHVCLGFPSIASKDDDYYTAAVLSCALGGGVSSRLFQEVREKRGLAYNVYSYNASYLKSGNFAAYASTRPKNIDQLMQVITAEFSDVAARGLSEEELQRSKQQLKGALVFGMESSSSVMNKIGKRELMLDELYSWEQSLDKLMHVSQQDVLRLAAKLFVPDKLVIATVGPQENQFDIDKLF